MYGFTSSSPCNLLRASYQVQCIPLHIDAENLIIVGSPHWSQDVDVAAADPVKGANIAYSLHFYAGTHKQTLRNKAMKAMELGAALFVTEWGACNADGNGPIDHVSVKH